ncbi:TPA: hypothetical protein DCE37_09600 [Candidatus Latescibacteria bacterium]|nr:hypothetical protein [Candidatus Latescibacterota bacterium]
MSIAFAGVEQVDPFTLKDEDGYFWLKGNLHSHTTNSDGKVEPQRRVDGYVGHDYDYLCLSDHHRITRIDSVSAPDDFTLIQGVELHPDNPFGGQRHHFVCLNLEDDIDAERMAPQHVIDQVRAQGGQAWLAHPHWSSISIARDVLPLEGLAGIEVFNTVCQCMGRGESGVHWDDWMEQEHRIYPMLSNDDLHSDPEDPSSGRFDYYRGWTMARVKDRSAESILEALKSGATYGSTGPEIHDIQIDTSGDAAVATVKCSEAQRIYGVCSTYGAQYYDPAGTFEEATFALRPGAEWVRFEVIGPDGSKAWSNPFDLA